MPQTIVGEMSILGTQQQVPSVFLIGSVTRRRFMKVFIADDSKLVRERLIRILSDMEGIEIAGEAGDAEEAIQSIQRVKPDVAILDIRMPGGNGIKVLETIKGKRMDVKVIMLTNYPYPQYRKKCMEAGADFFFDKSKEFRKIREVLHRWITESSGEKKSIATL